MKRKVLLISDAREIGGAEKYIENLLSLLNEKYCFEVIGNQVLTKLNIKGIHETLLVNQKPIKMILNFIKIYKNYKPDIVHLNLTHPTSLFWIQLLSLFFIRTKFVATLHLAVPNKFPKLFSFFLKITFSRINVILVSYKALEELRQYYSIDLKNAHIISNWVDNNHFRLPNSIEKENARRTLLLEKTQKVGIFVGRLEEQKNVLILPKIIEKLKETTNDNWKLIVLGDGSLKEELEKEIRKLDLEDIISIYPFTSDTRTYYWAGDIFFLLSNYECTPLTLLEAMSCGLSPIVTNVGDMKLMVGGNEYVWNRNYDDIKNLVTNTYGKGQQYWNNWVNKEFSAEKAKRQILKIYEQRIR